MGRAPRARRVRTFCDRWGFYRSKGVWTVAAVPAMVVRTGGLSPRPIDPRVTAEGTEGATRVRAFAVLAREPGTRTG
jgi:hypothetical protein